MAKSKIATPGSRKREMTGTNNDARKREDAVLHQRIDIVLASIRSVLAEFKRLEARVDNLATAIASKGPDTTALLMRIGTLEGRLVDLEGRDG